MAPTDEPDVNEPVVAKEPSMEEILASIRRIVDQQPSDKPVDSGSFKDSFIEAVRRRTEHYPDDERSILVNTLQRIVPELVAQAERLGAPSKAPSFCWEAKQIVEELNSAIRHPPVPSKRPKLLWQHRESPTIKVSLPLMSLFRAALWDMFGITSAGTESDVSIDERALGGVAARYLTYDWHHDHIDWCIVDALVYAHYRDFVGFLAARISSRRFEYAVMAIGAAILLVWLYPSKLIEYLGNTWAWWAIGIIIFDVIIQFGMQFENRPLLLAMRRGYQELIPILRVADSGG